MTLEAELDLGREAPKLSNAEKRALIAEELQKDPNRSDREIGRVLATDHKTVAAVRATLAEPPSPTARRHMLIEAAKDFDAKFPGKTAEEHVDDAIAKGVVSLSPQPEDDIVDFNWSTTNIVVQEQFKTAAFINTQGELVIMQCRWLDEDQAIYIAPHCIDIFIRQLQDIAKGRL